jgi:preprotein translocase subunit SecD
MRRGHIVSLIVVGAVSLGSLISTILGGHSPELGLDLQGGASVVLAPKTDVSSGVLDQAIEIIRSRVDALGVAEPDISRQGNTIVVSLPGVRNEDRALQLVGTTAQLLFRPVLEVLPPEDDAPVPTTTAPPGTTTTVPGATTTTTAPPGTVKTTPREEDKPEAIVVLP